MSNSFGFGGKKSKKLSSKNEPKSSWKNRHIDNHSWHHKDDSFWYKKGRSLVDSENYEEAIIAFDHALRCNPQNCHAWNSKGNCLYELKRYEDAITAYERAIDINPNISGFWANKACSLARLGKREEAILDYHHAISIPSDPDEKHEYWNNIGVAYNDLEEYEESIQAFERAIKIRPNFFRAWLNKGISLQKLDRYKESLDAYDHVIKFGKNNYRAWHYKGISLAKLGRDEESLRHYEKAIEINPNYDEAWYNRGVHLSRFESCIDAIESFDKVINIKPNYLWQAYHAKAHCLYELNHYEKALKAYEEAIKIKRNHNSLNGQGNCLSALKKYKEAIKVYEQSLKVDPCDWMAWINLSKAIFFYEDDYQKQIDCLEKGLKSVIQEVNPEGWGQLHRAIGNANYFYGRKQKIPSSFWSNAISSYETALKSLTDISRFETGHLDTLQDLICVLLGLGEIKKAEAILLEGNNFLDSRLNEQSEGNRDRFEQKFRTRFDELAVDLYVQQNKLIKAIEIAEKDKNNFLFHKLFANNSEKTIQSSPNYSQIYEFLKKKTNTAVVYWHLSDNVLTTFVLCTNNSSEIVLTLPKNTISGNELVVQRNKFKNWINEWLDDYDDYGGKKNQLKPNVERPESQGKSHPWRVQMKERLANLKTILRISDIENSLADFPHCNQLILISRDLLQRLPLDSLFTPKYTISYLPSIQVGIKLLEKSQRNYNRLLSIENPNSKDCEKLTAAEAESELICQMYSKATRLAKTETALSEVINQLIAQKPQPHTVLHFTGHAVHDFADTSSSALLLSDSDRLSLKKIAGLNLNSYQIACLSACETAVNSNQTLPKGYLNLLPYKSNDGEDNLTSSLIKLKVEDVSITSAFMYSGVANVVSTLWTVESISSAILMVEFHRHYLAGASAAIALGTAKNWLRNSTSADLAKWYQNEIDHLPSDHSLIPWLRNRLDDLDEISASTDLNPYNHPYYWSAFTITGL